MFGEESAVFRSQQFRVLGVALAEFGEFALRQHLDSGEDTILFVASVNDISAITMIAAYCVFE